MKIGFGASHAVGSVHVDSVLAQAQRTSETAERGMHEADAVLSHVQSRVDAQQEKLRKMVGGGALQSTPAQPASPTSVDDELARLKAEVAQEKLHSGGLNVVSQQAGKPLSTANCLTWEE